MLRCVALGICDNDLNNFTMGMIYDMLTEQENDQEKYPYKGTQEDIKNFFG